MSFHFWTEGARGKLALRSASTDERSSNSPLYDVEMYAFVIEWCVEVTWTLTPSVGKGCYEEDNDRLQWLSSVRVNKMSNIAGSSCCPLCYFALFRSFVSDLPPNKILYLSSNISPLFTLFKTEDKQWFNPQVTNVIYIYDISRLRVNEFIKHLKTEIRLITTRAPVTVIHLAVEPRMTT